MTVYDDRSWDEVHKNTYASVPYTELLEWAGSWETDKIIVRVDRGTTVSEYTCATIEEAHELADAEAAHGHLAVWYNNDYMNSTAPVFSTDT